MTTPTIRRVLSILAVCAMPAAGIAQQNPNVARGFEPEKAFAIGEFDHVNLFNGNLIVTLPIGPKYPVNGLSYNLNLVYNGNPWDFYGDGSSRTAEPSRFANAGLGWQLTMGQLLGPTHPALLGSPGRWLYAAPDGAERLFYPQLHPEEVSTSYSGNETDPGAGAVVGFSRDSSYLRLRRLAPQASGTSWISQYQIEFPDGTVHTFSSGPYTGPASYTGEKGMSYRLTRIHDRHNNHVAISYGETAETATWTITDTVGRTQTVHLKRMTFSQATSRFVVDRVVLHAFSSVASQTKYVSYTFEYSPYEDITKPCGDMNDGGGGLVKAVFLERIVVDKGGSGEQTLFAMPEYDKIKATAGCSHWAGHLKRLQLPTGGSIAYTASRRIWPGEREGGGGVAGGGGQIGPVGQYSAAVGTRTLRDRDGTTIGTWQYSSKQMNLHSTGGRDREMVVLVTDPTNRTTVHHFDISKGASDSCYPNSSMWEYGLPFTRTSGTGSGNYHLSTELFDGACADWEPVDDVCRNKRGRCKKADGAYIDTPEQQTWVRYTSDTVTSHLNGRDGDQNWRVQASRIIQRDAGCVNCATDTVHTDFDGLGHYRTTTRSSGIPGTPVRTTITHYNANENKGEYTGVGSSPTNYMVAHGQPWILGLHDKIETTDSGASVVGATTIVKEVCFNRSTGFLERTRALAGAARATNDLLTIFTASPQGNVASERYAGGDDVPLPEAFETCSGAPPAATYELLHAHSHGVRSSSKYVGTDFFVFDASIDYGTGLPRATRDTAGGETTYEYDSLQRLRAVRPPVGAEARYKYDLAANPASVQAEQISGSTVLTEARYYYDGFGRMIQSRTKMPSQEWSVREITYDALGRKVSVSAPESATSEGYADVSPARSATWAYNDPFGRATAMTQPDGASTTIAYSGSREVRRTSSIASEGSSGFGAPFTVTEVRDGHGRLVDVIEPEAGTTTYSYDAADHLTKVCMGGSSCPQKRFFTYDGRGLLVSEEHPEHNTVTYFHDAKGHVTDRLLADAPAFDQEFVYDVAERPLEVRVRDAGQMVVLKSFQYGSHNGADSDGADWKKGRLVSATRNNRVSGDVLSNMTVTETYAYDANGRRRKKTTEIRQMHDSTLVRKLEQKQQYDPLGAPTVLQYPVCIGAHCGDAPAAGLTNGYTNGALTSVSGYANSIEYTPSGMTAKVVHANGVTDEIAEDAGMGRPKSITVKEGVPCQGVGIAAQPASKTIARGTSTRLTVTASGPLGGLEYQWYQNGVKMRGEISGHLDTPVTQTTQSYSVRVNNTCSGVMSATATVTMVDPPAAPTGLSAIPAAGSVSIHVQWSAAQGAVKYAVERSANGMTWVTLDANVTGVQYGDAAISLNTAYLYRVRALEANGVTSVAASNADAAAVMAYSPLGPGTIVAASHLEELRVAVNALRKLKENQEELSWTTLLLPYGVAAPAPRGRIYRAHVLALRSAMTAARGALGLPELSFTDPNLHALRPKAVHVTDLRRGAE